MHPEFPQEGIIHLNHAAVGPWPRRTEEAVCQFARDNVAHGSRDYLQWLQRIDATRELARALIGAASAEDIAFVKNTSEALSMVAFGLDWQPGDNVVFPAHEFPSNRVVWLAAAERFGIEAREIDIGEEPERDLLAACDGRTRLVATSAVRYDSGMRIDVQALGAELRSRSILFCVDAIQHLGALPFDAPGCHADFVMADAHKWMLAPEGIGVFYVNPESRERLTLQEYGWNMLAHAGDFSNPGIEPARNARRFEPGSPNMLGIHALHASLSLLLEVGLETIDHEIREHWLHLEEGLRAQDCRILTPRARRAGIITFRPPVEDLDALYARLQAHGVLCAQRGGGIRFAPHFYLDREQIDQALEVLGEAIRETRAIPVR
ncbi:aminotransferase class V-fold PLP-dependent enzyme [Thioalkalivibrio sp. AKL19]|uniref:aminotransferase class V-fold PLP-dependent enzyme n=1 Tax=Thioalkalivibrio sp. AKL19 TaxID=1266914 RepID=UPI0004195C00|nr:aminotransferase class V-fold PLP-dependent enzyme [Thioalkalivibrio sp. AKL19]